MADTNTEDQLTFDLDLFTVPFEDTEFCNALPIPSLVEQCKTCVSYKNNTEKYTPTGNSEAYMSVFYYKDDTKSEKIPITTDSRLSGERATKLCILDLKSSF